MALIEDRFEDTLLVARPGVPAALVVLEPAGAGLPVTRTAGHHPADVVPTLAAIRDQLGLEMVMLGCRRAAARDGVAHRVLELEILGGALERASLTWVRQHELQHIVFTSPAHRSLLEDWFGRQPRGAEVTDGRDWAIPGWWARATSWIDTQVHAAGLGAVESVEQIRVWEFSCVLRVQTDQAQLYFKALPASYALEPALARYLAEVIPERVPRVIAIDQRARWLLTYACAGNSLESGGSLDTWRCAAAGYAKLQVALVQRVHRLRELGCQERGPRELGSLVAPLLADDSALLPAEEHRLTQDEIIRLRHLRPELEAACTELANGGLPLSVDHGDLWSSNVFISQDRVAFIDWTDACLSHPFLSLTPFLYSAGWDPQLRAAPDVRRALVASYLACWSDYADPNGLQRALALALPLGALHIAVTYWRHIPQPHAQWWMRRMVPFFLRVTLEEWR